MNSLRTGVALSRFFVLTGMVFVAGTTQAAEYRWTGNKSSNWSDPANWSSKSLSTSLQLSTQGALSVQTETSLNLGAVVAPSAPNGDDTVVITEGDTVQLGSDVAVANLTMERNSTLTGTGNITVSGTFNLTSASLTGSGTATIPARAIFNLAGGADTANPSRLQKKISNSGSLNFNGGFFEAASDIENIAGGVITVRATNLAAKAGDIAPRFINKGMLIKADAGNATFGLSLENEGDISLKGGALSIEGELVQRSGTIGLDGGQLTCPKSLNIKGGVLRGTGTINGSVLNDGGTVKPGYSPGIITINGNYTQTMAGILQMEIGGMIPGTQHDQMIVNGDANCEGTLDMAIYNNFIPNPGNGYELLQSYGMYSDFPIKVGMFPGTQRYYDSGILGTSYFASCYGDTTLPSLATTTPAANTVYTTAPTAASGTASDAGGSGLATVTAMLYRYQTNSQTAAYWSGGTTWAATYSSATHERVPTGTSAWSLALPTLPYGQYWIRSTAKDNGKNTRQVNTYFWKSNGTSAVGLSAPSASVATNSAILPFTAAIDTYSAQDEPRFAVKVNGVNVTVTNAAYNTVTKTVTLSLPAGTLTAGKSVVVTWNNLFDATGKMLNGSSPALTAA